VRSASCQRPGTDRHPSPTGTGSPRTSASTGSARSRCRRRCCS
jgi:hypothetical protein